MSTCATCSTRPRSRPSGSAGCRRRGARAQARRGRARRDADRRRPARGADAAPGRAHHVPARRRAACTPRASSCCCGARVAPRGAVVVRDATFAGRVGWRAVLAEPGRGTAVRSDVTSADPTRRLRVYPTALLASPANRTRRAPAGEPRQRDGHGAARRRRHGDDDRPRRGRPLRLGLRARGRRPGRAPAAPARGLRVGRGARAVARPRQGDGGRLPGRHARDGAPRRRARR